MPRPVNYPAWIKDLIYICVIIVGIVVSAVKTSTRVAVLEEKVRNLETMYNSKIELMHEKVTDIYDLLNDKKENEGR